MKNFSRIGLKFSLVVGGIILVIMPFMATLIINQTRQSLIGEMENRAQFLAREVKESFIPEPDPLKLYFSVTEMVKEKAILYAMVADSSGKILSHSDNKEIGSKTKLTLAENNEIKVVKQKGLYDITAPIKIGNILLGGVRIGFSDKSINEAIGKIRNRIILITVAVLLCSIIVSSVAVTFMVKPINVLADAAKKVGSGDLNQNVSIKRNDELGELARNFNEMITGLKDRDFIKDTFGKYVSKQVAEAILNGRLQLGGERRKASVLISDIRGFTGMSEKLSPEEVVDFLNSYFHEMVGVVTKYEGTLDKYIGDAILAVFGAPISHADDAKRAVFTAIEMQEKLKVFNIRRKEEGKEPIHIGIAVHTGALVAGNIGSAVRMEYTVIGDTVNLAARLEKLNKKFGTMVLLSESTYAEVKDIVNAREIPSVKIRGKEKEIKVYDVLGKKQGA